MRRKTQTYGVSPFLLDFLFDKRSALGQTAEVDVSSVLGVDTRLLEKPDTCTEETRLWVHVLLQAIKDLSLPKSKDKKGLLKRSAILWFKSGRDSAGSFNFIVENVLDLDPEVVKKKIFENNRL